MYSGWETVSTASKSAGDTGYRMTISLLMKDRKWRVAAVKLSVIGGSRCRGKGEDGSAGVLQEG
jgi:hypothetical protein